MKPNETFYEDEKTDSNTAVPATDVTIVPIVEIGQSHIDVAKQAIRKCQGQVTAIIDKYKDFKKPAIDSPDFKQRVKEIDADRKSLKAFRLAAVKDHEDYKKPALFYCTEIDKDLREYKAIIEPNEDLLSKMHAELEADYQKAENEKRNTRIKDLTDAGYELSEGKYVLLDRSLAYSELLKASDATIKSLVDFGVEITRAKKQKQAEVDAEFDARMKSLLAREAAVALKEKEMGMLANPNQGAVVVSNTMDPVPNHNYKETTVINAAAPDLVANASKANININTNADIPANAKVFGHDMNSYIAGFNQFRDQLMAAINDNRFATEEDLVHFVVNVTPIVEYN